MPPQVRMTWPRRWPFSKPALAETVAIIGAGPLGRWLALQAARGGFRVLLEDVMPSNLHHAQEWLRQQLGAKALGDGQDWVLFVSTIEDAVREADLAIDCVPDELESKLEIFCLLDRMAPPRTVIATPTTRLSIADLANCTYRPDKCVAIAAEASSLAEKAGAEILVQTTSRTSVEKIALIDRFWTRLGFAPIFAADPAEAVKADG
jgi:3-hydroxybutyryl-CoA dehydrogenase